LEVNWKRLYESAPSPEGEAGWLAMNTLDQISLLFVGVCAVGIAYLIFVEPIRQWLYDLRDKRKKPKP